MSIVHKKILILYSTDKYESYLPQYIISFILLQSQILQKVYSDTQTPRKMQKIDLNA